MSAAAGIEMSLRLGQHVRHRDHLGQRITGVVHGLSIDSDRVLQADIVLDAPIIIPARSADDRAISIWHQHVPAHELAPFDDRDELVAELLEMLGDISKAYRAVLMADSELTKRASALIAKATGAAP